MVIFSDHIHYLTTTTCFKHEEQLQAQAAQFRQDDGVSREVTEMENHIVRQEATLKTTLRQHPRLLSAVFAALVLLTTAASPASAMVIFAR